jgi:hypothetical protein
LEVGCRAPRQRLGGVNRATSGGSDILERKVEVVAEDDDKAPPMGQARERRAEVDQRRGVARTRLTPSLGFGDPEDLPPGSPQCLTTLIGDDTEKPRAQICPFAPIRSTPPGANTRVLDRVLGLDSVQEHARRQSHGLIEERSELRLERIRFTTMGQDIHRVRAAFE